MGKINVMHVTAGAVPFPPVFGGGIERYVHELSQSYFRRNLGIPSVITRIQTVTPSYPIISISSQTFGCLGNDSFLHKVVSKLNLVNFQIKALQKCYEVASKSDIDIIHVHDMFGASVFSSWNRLLRCPIKCLYTDHAPQWTTMSFVKWYNRHVMKSLTEYICSSIHRIAVTNEGTKNAIIRCTNIKPSRIVNVGIGIDSSLFDSASISRYDMGSIAEKYGIDQNAFIILFVGAIIPLKGPQVLLHAARKIVNETGKKICLVFVGSFSSYGNKNEGAGVWFNRLLSETGLGKMVRVLTSIPTNELLAIYKLSNVAVVPDLAQALPYSLLEAMSMGKIVVASNVGGIPEVIQHEKNGYLFSPGDSEELSIILFNLLRDYYDAEKVLGEARNTILTRYTWNKVSENNHRLYQDIIDK